MTIIAVDLSMPPDEDDPSAYLGLPADASHDDRTCAACREYAFWAEDDWSFPSIHTPERRRRSDGWGLHTFAMACPKMFKAIREHRRAVSQGKRQAKDTA